MYLLLFFLIICLFFACIYSLLIISIGTINTKAIIVYIVICLLCLFPAFGSIFGNISFSTMFSFTPNTSTFAVLVFFFTLLPFTSTSFVTILSFSPLPYSTSYVISISFSFSINGIVILNLFSLLSFLLSIHSTLYLLLSNILLSLSNTFNVSLTYLAFPYNVSSTTTSLASYDPIFLTITLYVFISPAFTSFLVESLDISILVSFILPFTFVISSFCFSSVFNPFTLDIVLTVFSSSDSLYITSYIILYFSSLSILSITAVILPSVISFSNTIFVLFVTSSPLEFIILTVSFFILAFPSIVSSILTILAGLSPTFNIFNVYVLVSPVFYILF